MSFLLENDKHNEVIFNVQIKSSEKIEKPPIARLIINNDISYMFEGVFKNNEIIFSIPPMNDKLNEGVYSSRLEIIIDDKIFVPLDKIETKILSSLKVEASIIEKQTIKEEKTTTTVHANISSKNKDLKLKSLKDIYKKK